jgi:uncharacterized membrane protein (DUF485 family)
VAKKEDTKNYPIKSTYSENATPKKKKGCISIIKTIMMWFSGFCLAFFTIAFFVTVKTIEVSGGSVGINISVAIITLVVTIYIWWEIIYSLRSR